MVSTAGGVVIAVVVLLTAAAVGWVVWTQVRARKLGLPQPGLLSYLPWKRSDQNPYGPPQPAPGGLVGWFNDQVRKVKNRNSRSAAGAYEGQSRGAGAGRRGFGPLDPDEAWDARVCHEADEYGYLEESDPGRHGPTEYLGGSYSMDLAPTPGATYDDDLERGRRGLGANPFDDDGAASSLRGVSPRPIDTAAAQKHDSRGDALGSAGSTPSNKKNNDEGSARRDDV
ncbi:hypothetical protein E4U41_002955 [Claviceps citrina]|nr:hypothetical protein E4U41_002955 [Claviceps citrina]